MPAMHGKLLFLGTGASMGTPVITCRCATCLSPNPLNKRLRPSALLKIGGKQFLIDVGPDFREQALRIGLASLDGLILTHTHFDHIAGIDDLRVFYFLHKKTLPCLLSKESLADLKARYHYFFEGVKDDVMGTGRFHFHVLDGDFGSTDFEGFRIHYLSYVQNNMKVLGFRIGNLAYVLDIREESREILKALKGVEILILSALRYTPSPAHFSLEQAVEFAKKVGAKKTWFSHIAHELDHDGASQKIPPQMQLAFDGLEIPFDAH